MSDGATAVDPGASPSFSFRLPSYVKVHPSPKLSAGIPAMFTGKCRCVRRPYTQSVSSWQSGDTADLGVTKTWPTVEPGLGSRYVFDFAFNASRAAAVDLTKFAAWRLGADFNAPLRAAYVTVAPAILSEAFFAVSQPNVDIVVVKPFSDNVIRGEVSAAPLDPNANRVFTIRLQESPAGRDCQPEHARESPGRRAHESDGRPPVAKPDIARAADCQPEALRNRHAACRV